MDTIYILIRTILIGEDGFKYDIYRCDDGTADYWHVIPAKQITIETKEGLKQIWVNLAPKTYGGFNELEFVISECQDHFQENK